MLAGLLLSSYATGWMGVKYIFGAFLFGVVMPREGAAAALREEILDRLEQLSVLVLLPVFFVVSGLSVNLSSVGLSGLTERCLILLVAVVGKFGGAFIGASLAGIRARRAGVLATLIEHPRAHRDRDPFGGPATAHPGPVAVFADDRDGDRDDDDGRAAAASHLPGSVRRGRHRGG